MKRIIDEQKKNNEKNAPKKFPLKKLLTFFRDNEKFDTV